MAAHKGKTLSLVLGVSIVAVSSLAGAQAVRECTIGQRVIDDRGTSGIIVSGRGDQCLIKYGGGQTQGWAPRSALHSATPAKPAAGATAPPPINPKSGAPPPKKGADIINILRPSVGGKLIYHADPRGHILLTATANAAPVRFLVDTGASLVFLTPGDAQAAGIAHSDLSFDRVVQTANGPVRAAFVLLREIRIEQLSIENVPSAVIKSLGQSVLGMSFLGRLKGLEMRDNVLTIDW